MKITLEQFMEDNCYDDMTELINEVGLDDSILPALCSEGCEVEPDGVCPHGGPSIALALGVI